MAGQGEPKTGKRRIEIMERRNQCMELRKAGLSLREIAKRVGISLKNVHRHISKAIAAIPASNVEQHRAIEGERLDRAQLALWPSVIRGDEKAIRTFISLSQRRAAMLGMDAPVKTQSVDTGSALPRRIEIPEVDERPEPHPEG